MITVNVETSIFQVNLVGYSNEVISIFVQSSLIDRSKTSISSISVISVNPVFDLPQLSNIRIIVINCSIGRSLAVMDEV